MPLSIPNLALLYSDCRGASESARPGVRILSSGSVTRNFRHPQFPIYLVTRLAAYDLAGVRAMIDRSLAARNRGKFVLDLRSKRDENGDEWLRNAAILLPAERVVLEETEKVVLWREAGDRIRVLGVERSNRKQRHLGFEWLPGSDRHRIRVDQRADVCKTAQWLEYRNLERSQDPISPLRRKAWQPI